MKIKPTLILEDPNWDIITRFLPDDWRSKAKELNACRRLRGIPSVDMLLRILMVHVSEGYSLIQTANIANQAGWATVSDVALLKRLRSAEEWIRWMCVELASRHHPGRLNFTKPDWLSAHQVRSIDATVISEPGSTGTDWRIHYSLGLFDLYCHEFLLTDPSTGEQISNFTLKQTDFIVADRAYCSGKFIKELISGGADFLLRFKSRSVRLMDDNNKLFDVLAQCRLVETGDPQSHTLTTGEGFRVRLLIHKKSLEAADTARKSYLREKRKKQKKVNPDSIELQGYIILITSKLDPLVSTADLLNLYRLRWQIELAFKRLKSIMGLGHLPKYDPQSCRAWLYGKLLTALLVEIMVEHARLFSPWGYPLDASQPE
ncbi:MAG: IS4 family transposase [Balneolales bacterium]|nr:IS4 family transposase [Balneolales bacterium]